MTVTQETGDISELFGFLADAATEKDEEGNPKPLAQGSFAMYPMPDGGVMFVSLITEGPMAGTHHHRIPPGLIRAATALVSGPGGKLKAIKGLFGGKG